MELHNQTKAAARCVAVILRCVLTEAYIDWATHLATSPGKQIQLWEKATKKTVRFAHHSGQCALQGGSGPPCIEPLLQDKRFVGDAWQRWPYNMMYQSFLLQQQWWHNATTGLRGVTQQHEPGEFKCRKSRSFPVIRTNDNRDRFAVACLHRQIPSQQLAVLDGLIPSCKSLDLLQVKTFARRALVAYGPWPLGQQVRRRVRCSAGRYDILCHDHSGRGQTSSRAHASTSGDRHSGTASGAAAEAHNRFDTVEKFSALRR